jgi:putative nucleotidyltransferase with HDIG domain
MTDDARRIASAEDLIKRFAASVKAFQLYAADHPLVVRATDQFGEQLDRMLTDEPEVTVGFIDRQVVVDGIAVHAPSGAIETVDRVRACGVERIALERGVTREELNALARGFALLVQKRAAEADATGLSSPHIRVGRLAVRGGTQSSFGAGAVLRDTYLDAVTHAQTLWDQACAEGGPDPAMALSIVDGLASAVGQNRRTMLALTALHRYDNYTFTHMVNVSVLTMAQARSLGIDGALLRQFGLAGLMHDFGKIRTPPEILTKPERLNERELAIMMRHPVDGAELLRGSLELPPLAAIVAFEHHLRIDGTGYPAGVVRPRLNLATQLCSIADVYDAMRSQRAYQQAFPTDRILKVLAQQDGARFDQALVRRFSQLMGIYPPGNIVRLDTGALAVVLRTHAPDPARPAVRVIVGPDGARLDPPVDLALWADSADPVPRIVTPVDPQTAGFDPIAFLDANAA